MSWLMTDEKFLYCDVQYMRQEVRIHTPLVYQHGSDLLGRSLYMFKMVDMTGIINDSNKYVFRISCV